METSGAQRRECHRAVKQLHFVGELVSVVSLATALLASLLRAKTRFLGENEMGQHCSS